MLRRFIRIDLVVAAVVAVVAGPAAESSHAAVPGVPGIYVNYSADCTFTMTADGGFSITSATAPGPILPPGTYQVIVTMPNPPAGYSPCVTPTFTLTGPGVSTQTVFADKELEDDQVVTLQPSSTYVASDGNAPAATQKVFTTAASGSSSSLLPAQPASTGPSTGSVQPDLVGSDVAPLRGVLHATVAAAGKATLKLGDRTAGSLKAGRYELKVDDTDAHAGFFVQRRDGKALAVTSLAFVGKRTLQITLTGGKWTFFSKVGGTTHFTVVA